MFNVPMTYSLSNAANRNLWQYDLTTATPNDILGAMNDASIWQYSAKVGSMVDSTAFLQMNMAPMMTNYYAQIGQMWQDMMTKIQANYPSLTQNWSWNSNVSANGTSNNNGKISEGKITAALEKMGSGKAVSERINQEITVDGTKTTILRRLLALANDYREDPKDAELSKENYEKIWEIADKYAKTGDVSSEDFATLKDIALNPSGESEDKDDKDDKEDKVERKNAAARTPDAINAIVEDFKNALTPAGTDTDVLGYAIDAVNKDNVLEVFDAYKKHIRAHEPNEKANLVDAILDDCSLWGGGDSDGWDMWFGTKAFAPLYNKLVKGKWTAKLGDDAKPRLEIIQEALIERANEFIKEHGEEKGITKEDISAFTLPQTEHNAYADEKRDDAAIKSAFRTFIAKLQQAEANVYED